VQLVCGKQQHCRDSGTNAWLGYRLFSPVQLARVCGKGGGYFKNAYIFQKGIVSDQQFVAFAGG